MFGFGFKVHADMSEVTWAERKLEHFSEHFEKHFWKHFNKTFGAGALAVGAFKLIEGVFGKPEEIEKEALKLRMTTDEVQLLQQAAKEMGLTFEEYLDRARKGSIDLAEAVNKARTKTDIVAREDIETLVREKKELSKLWEKIQNQLIHWTASGMRDSGGWLDEQVTEMSNKWQISRLANQNKIPYKEAERLFYQNYQPREEKPEEGPTRNPIGEAVNGLFPGMGYWLPSPGLIQETARGQMNAEIKRLQKRAHEIEADKPNPTELIQPSLTSRQQAGAYSSERGLITTKLDETNANLKEIQNEIKRLEDAFGNLE